MQEQRTALGLPEDAFSEYIQEEADDDAPIEVDPDNWQSALVFLDLSTSWRRQVPPMGGRVIWEGLIQADIWSVIRDAHGIEGAEARDVYRDIRLMEGAALEALNNRE